MKFMGVVWSYLIVCFTTVKIKILISYSEGKQRQDHPVDLKIHDF